MTSRTAPLEGFGVWEPEIAARLIKNTPHECFVALGDFQRFCNEIGLPRHSLLTALKAGDIRASGTPWPDGRFNDVAFRGDHIIAWLKKLQTEGVKLRPTRPSLPDDPTAAAGWEPSEADRFALTNMRRLANGLDPLTLEEWRDAKS